MLTINNKNMEIITKLNPRTIEIYKKVKDGQSIRKTSMEYKLTFTRVHFIYHSLRNKFEGIEMPLSMKKSLDKKRILQREYMRKKRAKIAKVSN